MRKLFYCLNIGLLFCFNQSFAQNKNIKGVLLDTTKTALPFATVMLLTPKDSALLSFTRTNDKGIFEFKNIKKGTYLFKATFVGLLPYQQAFTTNETEITDLGNITLKPIAKELMEVVIKTAKAPLSIRGDTVEYNASSFKVPPGSSVEDLLRKLPGIQVNQDGTIKAQGQNVKKVTVDGKRFFGDDPTMATKNLPAEAITKVQVFNDKSEQEKITGVDDGKQEKTINLELKDGFKKGGFGKVTAGVGNKERGEIKGNYNRFNDKEQVSVIGMLNNTNRTGMTWDDYQDFKGSQSFSWNDDADFGFTNNSGWRSWSSDDNEDDNISIPMGGGREEGNGFTNYASLGLNYNFDTKKKKLSSSYYFNQARAVIDETSKQQTFLQNSSFNTNHVNNRINFGRNQRATLRFEKEIDSLNTIILLHNSKYSDANNNYKSFQQLLIENNTKARETNISNATNTNSLMLANSVIYRHKFKKKGRNFAASASYNFSNYDGEATQKSINDLFKAGSVNDFIKNIQQLQTSATDKKQLKGSLFFLEPLSKKWSWESFYNFSQRTEEVGREVSDIKTTDKIRNNDLSRFYTNDISFNRVGSAMRYMNKGLNISAGLANQQSNLNGKFYASPTSTLLNQVSRTFSAWIPNVTLNFDLKNNRYLFANYSGGVQEPTTKQLQPIVDNSNPLFIQEGNPNLLPTLQKNYGIGFSKFNAANFSNLFFNFNYTEQVNQIVYNQVVDASFITKTKPVNISGGNNLGYYIGTGFPLKKTKSSINMNFNGDFGNYKSFINDVLNNTNTKSYNLNLRFDFTPNDKFTFYPSADWGISNTKYDLNQAQNQQILNTAYRADLNLKFGKSVFLNSKLNYNIYKNERFGFNQEVPIWNTSIYKIVGKDKKTEIRLSAYDLLNRNLGVQQSAYQNFVSQSRTQTLGRYFMLSFTYNMRGVKDQMRKDNNW